MISIEDLMQIERDWITQPLHERDHWNYKHAGHGREAYTVDRINTLIKNWLASENDE